MSTQTNDAGQAGAGAEPGAAEGSREAAGPGQAEQPSEAQLRAAYEAELSRITSVDMVLQAAASLLNIGAHRLGLTGGPGPQAAGADMQDDLEQVRDAIDGVRGLLPVIERRAPGELRPLRDALSQLQMAYSRAVQPAPAEQPKPDGQGAPVASPTATAPSAPGAAPAGDSSGKSGPGPAESSGRLWVPGR
jgi:hypothetical protein